MSFNISQILETIAHNHPSTVSTITPILEDNEIILVDIRFKKDPTKDHAHRIFESILFHTPYHTYSFMLPNPSNKKRFYLSIVKKT